MMALFRFAILLVAVCPLPAAILHFSGFDASRSAVIRFQADGIEHAEQAGVMRIQVDGAWNAEALCADLFTGIASGQSYDSTVTFGAMPRIAWLLANVLPGIPSGGADAPLMGAALQLAVWDIIHDNGDGLGAGRIQSSANTGVTVASYVNGYLGAPWVPVTGLAHFENTFQGTSIPAQSLVASAVPEPSPAALALTGVALIWFGTRNRGNQSDRR